LREPADVSTHDSRKDTSFYLGTSEKVLRH
jgi:hypothetical protein